MMKRTRIMATILLLAFASSPVVARTMRFTRFEYRGVDSGPTTPAGHYRNPIISGFYPDPSVVRVGADFYLVNSSFSWFPGIPVWHSRDLVHWRRLGNAIDRPGQLDFGKLGLSRGVFAPGIAWHKGRFYIVGTCVDCGGNFVITARDAAGPWSDPTWLRDVEGIDPSLFFDDDGSACSTRTGCAPSARRGRSSMAASTPARTRCGSKGRISSSARGVIICRRPKAGRVSITAR
jgi:xylan 1,4-beta-xylosidase